jgi:anti-sigma factor RsiW
MNCNEFVELVTAYLEGALDTGTEQRVVGHLAECDGCGRYLDQIRTTVTALGRLPADDLDPGVRADLLSALRNWETGSHPS